MVRLNNMNVGTIGFDLMGTCVQVSRSPCSCNTWLTLSSGFTWRPKPTPTSEAIAVMKTAVANGAICWNGGTFYGPQAANSLQLLNAYFTEYPEDANKVVISIKGPVKGDEASVRSTVDECLRVLHGKKHLDIFQCARVDPKTPIEETVRVLAQYVR
jgi:pyridoxine 4-dehydrogenase